MSICFAVNARQIANDIILVTNREGDTVGGVLEYRLVELEIYFGDLFFWHNFHALTVI